MLQITAADPQQLAQWLRALKHFCDCEDSHDCDCHGHSHDAEELPAGDSRVIAVPQTAVNAVVIAHAAQCLAADLLPNGSQHERGKAATELASIATIVPDGHGGAHVYFPQAEGDES